MDGNVTVSYTKQDGTKISATIFVEVGKMPIVAMDFEDTTGIQGEDVVGLWDWGTTTSALREGGRREELCTHACRPQVVVIFS